MQIIHLGANGWRARFDDGFDAESVARVAAATGYVLSKTYPGAKVLVGYDTRHEGRALARLAGEVMASSGLAPALSLEPCPISALSWAALQDERCCGVLMLSAGESPCEYGGIELRGADGGPLSTRQLERLERHIPTSAPASRGPVSWEDFLTPYREALLGFVDTKAIAAAKIKVVADPMHGGACGIFAHVLEQAGCEVISIHSEPLENFGNIHPIPIEPWADECEQAVLEHGAQLGLLVDGHGVRSSVVDEKGRLVSPHLITPLIMEHLARKLGHGRVVATLACSERVPRQAEALGLPMTQVPVGFERIYAELEEGDVLMASDEYGGICVPRHALERDALLTCLLIVEMLATSHGKLSKLVKRTDQKLGPMKYLRKDIRMDAAEIQTMRNVLPGINPKKIAGKKPVDVRHTDGIRLSFKDGSWVMVRPSRTQATVRAYCEAPTSEQVDKLLKAALDLPKHA